MAIGGSTIAAVNLVKEHLNKVSDTYNGISSAITKLAEFDTYIIVALAGLALYSFVKARKIEAARLNDHRIGKTA